MKKSTDYTATLLILSIVTATAFGVWMKSIPAGVFMFMLLLICVGFFQELLLRLEKSE